MTRLQVVLLAANGQGLGEVLIGVYPA